MSKIIKENINLLHLHAKALIALSGRKVVIVCMFGVVIGVLLGISEIIFGLSLANFLTSYEIIDSKGNHADWLNDIATPLVLVIVLGFIVTVFRFLSFNAPAYARQLMERRVRKLVNEETMRGQGDISELSVANLTHIMVNLSPGIGTYLNALSFLFLSYIRLFVLLAGLFAFSTQLSLLAMATIVLFGLPTLLCRKFYIRVSRAGYDENASFTENIIRNVRNVLLLQFSGQINNEREKLSRNNEEIYKYRVAYNSTYFANMVWPNILAVVVVVVVVVINFEARFVENAMLVPFVFLLSRIAAAISAITDSYGKYQLHKPASVEMLSYNNLLLENKPPLAATGEMEIGQPTSLSAQGLTIGRDKELIRDINIELEEGEMLLIGGESGVGKTTLIYTILGLLNPMRGHVYWNGINIFDINPKIFRSQISYSGSDPFLIDATIEENIRFGQNESEKYPGDIDIATNAASCEFINELEGNLNFKLKEGGDGISAGQRQRISIARALLRKPKVLILDEATSNIDTEREKAIFTRIQKLYPDMMIILVSHRDTAREFTTKTLNL